MQAEAPRDARSPSSIRANLKKQVNKSIKEAKWTSISTISFSAKPIFLDILQFDQIDLAKKFLKECYEFDGKEGLTRVLKYMNNDYERDLRWSTYSPENWNDYHIFNDVKTVFDFIKSDEMRKIVDEYFEIIK